MVGRRRVVLLATGGTIACTVDDRGRAAKTLGGTDLLAAVAPVPGVDVRAVDHGRLSSWDIAPPDMLDIALRVDELLTDTDGVVVTHGTDTLEETAALLSFAVRSDAAVVVTGAMRAGNEPGADGPRNLRAALRVAAAPDARGRGPLVVMDDEVHRGVTVTKRHSSAPGAFGSPATGPVGLVHGNGNGNGDGDGVTFLGPAGPRTRYDVAHADADVPLLLATAGAPDRVLHSALAGADGLVVAGFGLGHVPGSWVPVLGDAVRRGVPVVMATRTSSGPVGGRYLGAGGDEDVRAAGILSAGYRSPYAARIELLCALGAGADPVDAFRQPLP